MERQSSHHRPLPLLTCHYKSGSRSQPEGCSGKPGDESLKVALQKFTNLDLDSYKRQVILKDKFQSQCTSDIRIKLQQLQQQDSAASLDEMVQTATNTFYNRVKKREDQGPGKGEKERDKSCPDAGGKPNGKP